MSIIPEGYNIIISCNFNYVALLIIGSYSSIDGKKPDEIVGEGYLKIYDNSCYSKADKKDVEIYTRSCRYNLLKASEVNSIFGTENFAMETIYSALAEHLNGYYWNQIDQRKMNYMLTYRRLFPGSFSDAKVNDIQTLLQTYFVHADFYNEINKKSSFNISVLINGCNPKRSNLE